MDRLIILSYDATEAFKKAYRERNGHDYDERLLWDAINEIPGIEINGKPVKSTLVIDAEDMRDYKVIVQLIKTQFDGLSYVVGTIAKSLITNEDYYDEDSNPDSDEDYTNYLLERE